MRHLFGVVLGVLTGGALFVGAGWGVDKITTLRADGSSLSSTHGLIAIAAVGAVGLLLGILLAVPAISPLAPGLPGVVLLGWSALLVASTSRATRLIPLHAHTFAVGFHGMLTSGMLALLGAALIVPLFVPSRWRRRYEGEDDYADEPSSIGLMR
ncbi:MAG TPA: hypothetical protein VMF87_06345 [Streptosporangiaceae bacterium]|nr:hypothetical protein [Streptosporangiaceae bacterium]